MGLVESRNGMCFVLTYTVRATVTHSVTDCPNIWRIRKVTSNVSYLASCELNLVPFGALLKELLNKPGEITNKDPAVLYACIYGGIVYATYYSFFEAFTIMYLQGYGMSLGELRLIFTSIIVGCVVGLGGYWWYLTCHFIPSAKTYYKNKGVPVP